LSNSRPLKIFSIEAGTMSDQAQRDTALSTESSFVVQAPAGSGKTELLIQRYLALLARVDLPEQVVAFTFTRKAAAEMRRRVFAALAAAHGSDAEYVGHQLKTHRLANAVLEKSRACGWTLTEQPQRLRIDTLDAMNSWLAHRLPVLAGGLAGTEVTGDARECYAAAVGRTLDELGRTTPLANGLRDLLRGVDNSAVRLERLLLELLPQRDQWLPYLAAGSDAELLAVLERALLRLVEEALADSISRLPPALIRSLDEILRHAAEHAADADLRERCAAWSRQHSGGSVGGIDADAWRGAADVLLTQKNQWRKRPEASQGFSAQHPGMRERLRVLLEYMADDGDARQALTEIRTLPPPRYSDADRRLLVALRHALRRLAAEVKVVFSERGVVDFIELALSAQQALGRVDAPSELLLALDHRIQHLLVDEFQDTSHSQLRLIRLLTAGWQQGDGRTLFLVGDPMQSIYRFRQADMSLFLRTKAFGIGDVRCEPLLLERNFRSAPAIVDWVNTTFEGIFPPVDDLGAGAAKFNPCVETRTKSPDQGVSYHLLRENRPESEIGQVIALLAREMALHPQGSIAVLVQSRSHLAGLHRQLRASGLAVHAVELEAPNQRQVVQDLLGLTRAATHLADRVAWLSVLRAPWCGLTWSDLHTLSAADADEAIWTLMHDEQVLAGISDDGRRRLLRLREALAAAFDARERIPFALWLEQTWESLGGPSCLDHSDEHQAAERFFVTVSRIQSCSDLDDPAALEAYFTDPHGGDIPRESGAEIMTIHRAKGLEFDTVILLGLGRRPRPEGAKGLYWYERVADDGSEDLLLAPLARHDESPGELTAFIRQADAVRDQAERKRLLYVATTRARERLHLVAQLREDAANPPANSLLSYLWPAHAAAFEGQQAEPRPAPQPLEFIVPKLRRLVRLEPFVRLRAWIRPEADTPRPEFLWASHAAVQVGTLVHRVLHEIALSGADAWSLPKIQACKARFHGELELLGVESGRLEASTQRVVDSLCGVLSDARGIWLLQEHDFAESELPLTVHGEHGLEHMRIDRTFVDESGRRWIVDFKTSLHEGGSLEAFLDSEAERYRAQLARYAGALAAIDPRPTEVGLYFPLLQAFRSWPAGA
jgi:ATP-dependent exoDNAse (exonuclease V) beta subunit